MDLTCSSNSAVLVCATGRGLVAYDTGCGTTVYSFSTEPKTTQAECITLSADGDNLLTGSSDGMIRLYDMRKPGATLQWQAHDCPVTELKYTPSQLTALSMGTNSTVLHWDIRSANQHALEKYVATGTVDSSRWRMAVEPGTGARFFLVSSPHGVSGAAVYEFGIPYTIAHIGNHNGPINDVCWHPDLPICGTASADCLLRLWDFTVTDNYE